MKITIKIGTSNAAFTDNTNAEVARILAGVVEKLNEEYLNLHTTPKIPLFDINGNIVGYLDVSYRDSE